MVNHTAEIAKLCGTRLNEKIVKMNRTNKPTILFRHNSVFVTRNGKTGSALYSEHNYDPAKAVKSAIDLLLFLEDFACAEELLGINKEKQK